MKEPLINPREQFLPESQRPLRRARVDFISAIAHPNDARFVTGTRTAVARTMRIDEYYTLSSPLKLISGPRAKHSRADNCHVVYCFRGLHRRRIIASPQGMNSIAVGIAHGSAATKPLRPCQGRTRGRYQLFDPFRVGFTCCHNPVALP